MKVREALEFYADPMKYWDALITPESGVPFTGRWIQLDQGEKARKALAALEGVGVEEILRGALCDAVEDDKTDNLAIVLATYYEHHPARPDPDPDSDDLGWGDWVMQQSDAALARIVDAALAALGLDEKEKDDAGS